jgi:redox-sensing transcriptional repressor
LFVKKICGAYDSFEYKWKKEVRVVKEKEKQEIPKATAKRLSLYYRTLRMLFDQGVARVNSSELSEALQIDSATIRRDFSYFGELGKRGFGYDVESLMKFFEKTLNDETVTEVALIGVGNLGQALLNYNFAMANGFKVVAAFDKDEEKVGTVQNGISIYSMNELEEILKEKNIRVVILTVPVRVAQDLTDKLVNMGIEGILNFSPIRLLTPSNVVVQSVDLTSEMQTLIYFMKKNKN